MPLSKLPLHCMIISFLFSLLVTFWRNFFKKPHLFSTSNFFSALAQDFAESFLEDKLTPFYKSEPVPESVSES